MKIPESKVTEIEDIQRVENSEVDKTTLTVIHQADHEDENLDVNLKESKE